MAELVASVQDAPRDGHIQSAACYGLEKLAKYRVARQRAIGANASLAVYHLLMRRGRGEIDAPDASHSTWEDLYPATGPCMRALAS